MASIDPRSLGLRQLRAVMLVGETGSVTSASSAFARSQSAITKAVSQVEKKLGVSLFDRTPSPSSTVLMVSRAGESVSGHCLRPRR